MNWSALVLVAAVMSITANGFLVYLIRVVAQADNPLMEELRGQIELLRTENYALYEKIELMAASVPHIRIAGREEKEVEAVSNLEILDEEGVRIGNKGANVA